MRAAPKTTDICLDDRGVIVPLWVKKYTYAVQRIGELGGFTSGQAEILEGILSEGLPMFFESQLGQQIKKRTTDGMVGATIKCWKGKAGQLNDSDLLYLWAKSDVGKAVSSPTFEKLAAGKPGKLLQKLGRALETSKRSYHSVDHWIGMAWDGTLPKLRWLPPLCFTSDKVGAWMVNMTEPNFIKHRQRMKLQRAPFKLLSDINDLFGK